eukprot:COSAG02_NODE_5673_length_4139_cov_2.729950_2_plen_837_part_00
MLRWAALLLLAAQGATETPSVIDDDESPVRRCPPGSRTAADVLLVVAGGRPKEELWRSVQSQVAAWFGVAGAEGSTRVAVAQHSVGGGLELLTAPNSGGFVSATAGIDALQWDHFRRAPSAAPRISGAGPWRRTQISVVANSDALAGLRAAAAALRALAAPASNASNSLLPRDVGRVAIRMLLLVTSAASDLVADSHPTPAKMRLSQRLFALQEAMQLDFSAAEDAVAAVRAASANLRRKQMVALRQTRSASASSARGNEEVDALRVGFILDGRGHPAVLRRALYGEPGVEDCYKDGREGGMGITYHRARESCHKSWHPLCGKGGSLQGRLLHDGTGVRITEHNSTYPQTTDRGDEWPGTPLQWLVPMPQLILPPCEPRYPWALPKQPPLPTHDHDGGDDDEGNSQGGDTGEDTAGFCQLYSTGRHADMQRYEMTQKDAEARAAARLDGVADAKQLQKMFRDDSVDDVWQPENNTNATHNSKNSTSDTTRTVADVAWAQRLKTMACGSPHSSDSLLETNPSFTSGASMPRNGSTVGSIKVIDWRVQAKEPGGFTDWAVKQSAPLLLRGTPFVQWVAERTSYSGSTASADEKVEKLNSWSWGALERRLAQYPMLEAKRSSSSTRSVKTMPVGSSDASTLFFDPDVRRAPMSWSGLVSAETGTNAPDQRNGNDDDDTGSSNVNEGGGASGLPYEVYNTTGRELLQQILLHDSIDPPSLRHHADSQKAKSEMVYWFDKLPEMLVPDIASVTRQLFLRESDLQRYEQYIWFSSAGVRMHTHVDADHNFFLQVAGRKRWTLYPTAETAEMHPFPRTHPLWHKAQRSPLSSNPTARFPVRNE